MHRIFHIKPYIICLSKSGRGPWGFVCALLISLFFLSACSSTKFVGEDEYLLADAKVKTEDKTVKTSSLKGVLRQKPNSRWFNLYKAPLHIYSLSSRDTTRHRRWNRMLRRLGEAPVIYDSVQTELSVRALEQALQSKGYLHARATSTTEVTGKKKKRVTYTLLPGPRHYIDSLSYEFDNAEIERIVRADSQAFKLHRGLPLDLSLLSAERDRIISLLGEKGRYGLHKEYISYRADTLTGSTGAVLTLRFKKPAGTDERAYQERHFSNVNIYEGNEEDEDEAVYYRGLTFHLGRRKTMNKRVYFNHILPARDSLYKETLIQGTYAALGSLPCIASSNIRIRENAAPDSTLDADISVKFNKPHTVGMELEGTNTAGDFGVAASVNYANRNLFRGAEVLSLKLRGAYEAITGLEGYDGRNYLEWNAEASLKFPSLLVPFLPIQRGKRIKASSEVTVVFSSQNRPEFHRRVLTGSWAYQWSKITKPRVRHRFDLLNLNYIFMPVISETFRNEYLSGDDPRYGILRYSYEDLFIMKMGYGFTFNSLRSNSTAGLYQTNGYQIKVNVETAGNLLYGISKLTHAHRSATKDAYTFLGIAYSQYARLDFDFSKSIVFTDRASMAIHAAFGIAQPYGNSTILPYERRYFAGGANSVRGWSVRGLGPGTFKGKDGKIDFINQTGNLKLDLSVEWRAQLFWKLHGAFFLDAGNIWNTRKYADQPGGEFRFNKFYRQIAAAYGVGLRLNFDYFILRLDGGMKAVNPTEGEERYPLIHPKFSRDFTLHFAVGLPF